MKKAAIVFLIIGMVASTIYGLINIFNFDRTAAQLRESLNYDITSLKGLYIAVIVVSVVIALAIGAISLYIINKRETPTAVMTMGILSLIFVNLIAGILMIVYANALRKATALANPNVVEVNVNPVDEKPEEPQKPLAAGDSVTLSDGRKGKINSIDGESANVHLLEDDIDVVVNLSSLTLSK